MIQKLIIHYPYKTLSSLLKAFKKLDNDKETRVIILEGSWQRI